MSEEQVLLAGMDPQLGQIEEDPVPPAEELEDELPQQDEPQPIGPAPPIVRRSKRISEKEQKTYSVKKSRAKKLAQGAGPSNVSRALELELIATLQNEALQSDPINEEMAAQVDKYCGILAAQGGAQLAAPVMEGRSSQLGVEVVEHGGDNIGVSDQNESVMAAFESDSGEELSDGEEDGSE